MCLSSAFSNGFLKYLSLPDPDIYSLINMDINCLLQRCNNVGKCKVFIFWIKNLYYVWQEYQETIIYSTDKSVDQ